MQGNAAWYRHRLFAALCVILLLPLVCGRSKAFSDPTPFTLTLRSPGLFAHADEPDETLTAGPPAKAAPSVPGWGFYPQYPQAWQAMHKGFLERTRQGKVDVVFVGDSLTQGWGGEGKDLWEKRFAPLGAVNYGIGGDSTRQVLWRIGHGGVDGLHPKLFVLMIGTNNLYGDFNAGTDEEIADGVKAVVTTLRQKQPQAKILLCGLLPRQNDYFCNRIAAINRLIGKLDDGKNVRFLDMQEKYLTAPGKVKPELYVSDQLHLAKPGYTLWADTMQPLFTALLGKTSLQTLQSSPQGKQEKQ